MVKEYLKVKIMSLAEEAKIIRRLENKRKRKAAYVRQLLNYDRTIAYHEREIKRLDIVINRIPPIETQERIQWHRSEIKRLQRQHNKTKVSEMSLVHHEDVHYGLHDHRIRDVRKEARSALLAYGFLNGYQYDDLERKARLKPDFNRVKELILKYGEGNKEIMEQSFEKWKENDKVPA